MTLSTKMVELKQFVKIFSTRLFVSRVQKIAECIEFGQNIILTHSFNVYIILIVKW